MLIDGEKWACEACVRGHRVTTCKHHGIVPASYTLYPYFRYGQLLRRYMLQTAP